MKLLLLVVLLLVSLANRSESCTCELRHAQSHFCTSNYVVKAYVVSEERGYFEEGDFVPFVHDIFPEEPDTEEEIPDTEDKETQPEPIVGEAVDPELSVSPEEHNPDPSLIGTLETIGSPNVVHHNPVIIVPDPVPDNKGETTDIQVPTEVLNGENGREEIIIPSLIKITEAEASKLNDHSPLFEPIISEIQGPPIEDQPANLEAAAYRRPYDVMYRGPDSAMPGQDFQNVRAKPLGLTAVDAPPSAKPRLYKRNKRQLRGLPPGSSLPGEINEFPQPTHVRYTVNVVKAYKGKEYKGLDSNSTMHIHSPLEGWLCGTSLDLKSTYVIMGYLNDEGLFYTRLCDYQLKIEDMDTDEIKHLGSNLSHRFKAGCKCYIKVCYNEKECKKTKPQKNECFWRNRITLFQPKSAYFTCVARSGSGNCRWHNDLKRKTRPKDM